MADANTISFATPTTTPPAANGLEPPFTAGPAAEGQPANLPAGFGATDYFQAAGLLIGEDLPAVEITNSTDEAAGQITVTAEIAGPPEPGDQILFLGNDGAVFTADFIEAGAGVDLWTFGNFRMIGMPALTRPLGSLGGFDPAATATPNTI